jgi:hypothetical protein
MALNIADRVKESSTSTGTGTLTLGGAVSGFQSFATIGNGNQCYYTIVHNSLDEWEVGVGTYTVSGTTLSRDTVLDSSSGGAKVSFSVGNKEVFVTYPADRSVSQADIGTAPNEIPLNQYLGNLAFQSSESAIIESGRIDLKGGGSNLLTYSQEFDNAYWTKSATTLTANAAVAPDGTTTADKITDNASNTVHGVIKDFTVVVGVPYTLSIFAQANDSDILFLGSNAASEPFAYFDLTAGTVGTTQSGTTASIVDFGGGIYRCIITGNSVDGILRCAAFVAQSDGTVVYVGDGSRSLYIWGAQLEQSSALGNYIATTTSAITLENAPGATALSVIPTNGSDTTYPLAFELASDTSLIVKVKGSDGTVRSATLTLA